MDPFFNREEDQKYCIFAFYDLFSILEFQIFPCFDLNQKTKDKNFNIMLPENTLYLASKIFREI